MYYAGLGSKSFSVCEMIYTIAFERKQIDDDQRNRGQTTQSQFLVGILIKSIYYCVLGFKILYICTSFVQYSY